MDKNFHEYASTVGCCTSDLEDAISALYVLDDAFDSDGFQREDKFEDWIAINFAKRFPMYLGAFRTITRQLQQIATELHTAEDKLFALEEAGAATA